MKVTVKYFAMIREITHKAQEAVDINEGASLELLLYMLSYKYGKQFELKVYSKEKSLNGALILLVNGNAIKREELKNKMLADGDTIAILPPIGGG